MSVWPLVFRDLERVFSLWSVVGVYVLSWAWVEGLFTSSIVDYVIFCGFIVTSVVVLPLIGGSCEYLRHVGCVFPHALELL